VAQVPEEEVAQGSEEKVVPVTKEEFNRRYEMLGKTPDMSVPDTYDD
jgi:hypothetical protein